MSDKLREAGGLAMKTLCLACLGVCALLPQMASAQAQAKSKRAPKVIQLEEIKIEGRVQKPNAFYILNRSNLGYEVLDLRTSFVRDIVRSVQSDAF
jgi:hypothetical protein